MLVMKFDFEKIFSLSYMGKLCNVQNFVLLLWYKDTFIDSYCLLQIDYSNFFFELIMGWQCTLYKLSIYMLCGDTPHFVISIWMQTWIWIMDLHGMLRHFIFHNIHMGTDMAPCLHIITVTYFRYQNRPIQNRYHIIYHNSRILNIKSLNFEI